MLSFNDAEEQIVNKILDSLATMDFQQINFSAESVLSFSNITIYPQEFRIEINGESLTLSRRQFDLLYLLARNVGRILTKEQIYSHVWNEIVPINVDETIRYHISEIRKKLNELADIDCIETVWGIGYRFKESK
ncbi:MAG: winged helix-turn-helix domain-containing protein [Clostridiales bacterium]|nr:winged helix-turn-helix domain-containing protein [Clostridiales bacterium]